MKKLKVYLTNFPQAKILDIGTGRGNFISLIDYIYNDYSEIIGIDVLDYLLDMNRENFKTNPKIKFIEDDILNTNLAKESFDVICLSNTLHHLENIKATFREMRRLLKPQGIIIVNEMISDNLNEKQISHKLLHHFAAKVDMRFGNYHQATFTENQIKKTLSELADLSMIDTWKLDIDLSNEAEDTNQLVKIIDRLLEQVKVCDDNEVFLEEANEIKTYLKNNGFDNATQVVLVLKRV